MRQAALALALLCCAAAPNDDAPSRRAPAKAALPSDLPLGADGVPYRPLDDAELYRLLVALSASNEPAAFRLARCHAEGASYGTEGWRACVSRR